MKRHIFVGDVHGCASELKTLLGVCRFDPAADQLVLVGDLLAKGPESGEVVRFAREVGALGVRGNHDERVLHWRAQHIKGANPPPMKPHHMAAYYQLSKADWPWLQAQPDFRRIPELNVIVVHAGLVPGIPMEEQRRDLLFNIRSVKANGEGSKRHEDGEPWASRWNGPERVVFGHDAVRGLQKWPFATGLDTGCCYGGQLTALILPDDLIISVPAEKAYVAVDRD